MHVHQRVVRFRNAHQEENRHANPFKENVTMMLGRSKNSSLKEYQIKTLIRN